MRGRGRKRQKKACFVAAGMAVGCGLGGRQQWAVLIPSPRIALICPSH